MSELCQRSSPSRAPQWVRFATQRSLEDLPQLRWAVSCDCKVRSLAALEMEVKMVRSFPVKGLLVRNLSKLSHWRTYSLRFFISALTGARDRRARKQNLVDPLPRHSPGVCYHSHLVLIYPLQRLRLSSFASFFSICM